MLSDVRSSRKPAVIILLLSVNQSTVEILTVFKSPWKISSKEIINVISISKLLSNGANQATLSLIKNPKHADSRGKQSVISANRKGEERNDVSVKTFLLVH